jgi:hypothetical protein
MAQQQVVPSTLTFLSQGLEPWRNGWHSNRLFRVRLPFSVRALNHVEEWMAQQQVIPRRWICLLYEIFFAQETNLGGIMLNAHVVESSVFRCQVMWRREEVCICSDVRIRISNVVHTDTSSCQLCPTTLQKPTRRC